MNARRWQVGELSQATGLTVRTLHYYEQLGLLVSAERTDAGYRLYTEDDVRRLYRIVALRSLGLRLREIGELLTHGATGLAETVSRQLEYVERRLEETEELRRRLLAIRDALDREAEPSIETLIETMEALTMHDWHDGLLARVVEFHGDAEELDALAERVRETARSADLREVEATTEFFLVDRRHGRGLHLTIGNGGIADLAGVLDGRAGAEAEYEVAFFFFVVAPADSAAECAR